MLKNRFLVTVEVSPHASDWKEAIPTNKDTTLTNTQYQIAARLNLGIPMRSQCPDCHGCHVRNALKNDPYHYLSCPAHRRREITFRHNLVLQVVHRYINYVGGVAVKEPHDLHDADGRRPDLQLILRDVTCIMRCSYQSPTLSYTCVQCCYPTISSSHVR